MCHCFAEAVLEGWGEARTASAKQWHTNVRNAAQIGNRSRLIRSRHSPTRL